jgi:hypothetical protein
MSDDDAKRVEQKIGDVASGLRAAAAVSGRPN